MRSFVLFGHLRPELARAAALACGWSSHDLSPAVLTTAGLPKCGVALRHPDAPYDVFVLSAPPSLEGVGRWRSRPDHDEVHAVTLDADAFQFEVADAPVAAALIRSLHDAA